MMIPVIRTKLFFDGGNGEAPIGTIHLFDMTTNYEFLSKYEYRPKERWPEYARELLEVWNKRGRGNWKYELAVPEQFDV